MEEVTDVAGDVILTPIETVWRNIELMGIGLLQLVPNIVIGLLVIAIAAFLAGMARKSVERTVRRSRFSTQVGIAFGRIAHFIVLFIGVFLAAITIFPSLKIANLFEVLGIGGVAIGFAFRDIFQNTFAGLLLLINEPFQIGDQIIYGDFEGNVIQIETRATTIRSYDGRDILVPNGDLYTNVVVVNTARSLRRFEITVGVAYDTDIASARAIIKKVVEQIEDIHNKPAPAVLVSNLGESTIDLRVLWWAASTQMDGLTTRDIVLTNIVEAFDSAEIIIPFPTRSLLMKNDV